MVAERAPAVFERIRYAKTALRLSEPLLGGNSLVSGRDDLKEFLGAREALRLEGGLVLCGGFTEPRVVPSLVKEVGQVFLLATGKVGHCLLRISRELGVESGKASVTVRARTVAAKFKASKQGVGHL